MKVRGLVFKRLNEEFEMFCLGEKGIHPNQLSKEEAEEVIYQYEDLIIEDSLKALWDRYPKFYSANVNNQTTISKEMEPSFRYFFSYLNTVNQIYESLRKFLKNNDAAYNYSFIIPHYGILVRLADQIGVMLLNGYPDGALRIWRTFYEYTMTTLLFVKEIDNETIQTKFIDHYHRNKGKKSESYQKNHEELKFPSLDETSVKGLKDRINEFNEKYGKDFLDDEYGWCRDALGLKKKVTLRDIEEFVGLKRFRPFYIWASGYTHAGFESMLDFFKEDEQKIVLNEINTQILRFKSFIDPMQLTVCLFHEVNLKFLEVYSDDTEYDVNVLMLQKIFEALLTTFGDEA